VYTTVAVIAFTSTLQAKGRSLFVTIDDPWKEEMNAATPLKERELGARTYKEIEPLDENDAQLVNAAQRCFMMALDHSRAQKIMLLADGKPNESHPVIELPPAALRVVARVLGLMGERKPLVLIPRNHELSTQEVANMLNVSRPFVVKEIEEGRLQCHMVGSHRRVSYEDFVRYREAMRADQEQAMRELAQDAQELGLGYK
jgi:excisionase family DNA binding protein